MLVTLADAAASGGIDYSPIIAAVGSLGFAIWFGVYVMMYHLPNQQKEHREERREMLATFAQTIKELVDELKDTREAHDRWRMATK